MIAPVVHEFTHSACCVPVSFVISSSKAFTLGPVVIQPERRNDVIVNVWWRKRYLHIRFYLICLQSYEKKQY